MKHIDIERASNETILVAIGEALASRIDQKPGTRKDFSKKAGVGRTSLYRLINGEKTNVDTFIRVVRALGMKEVLYALTKEAVPSPMQTIVKNQTGKKGRHIQLDISEQVTVSSKPATIARINTAKPKRKKSHG